MIRHLVLLTLLAAPALATAQVSCANGTLDIDYVKPDDESYLVLTASTEELQAFLTEARRAIERGVAHEGKMYNFDFDFFSSDRLVCTEVVYRSYDGLDGITFTLTERAGRKTLSAEDLLDFALDSNAFEPVAIFGVAGCEADIAYGDEVRPLLLASYREQ